MNAIKKNGNLAVFRSGRIKSMRQLKFFKWMLKEARRVHAGLVDDEVVDIINETQKTVVFYDDIDPDKQAKDVKYISIYIDSTKMFLDVIDKS